MEILLDFLTGKFYKRIFLPEGAVGAVQLNLILDFMQLAALQSVAVHCCVKSRQAENVEGGGNTENTKYC